MSDNTHRVAVVVAGDAAARIGLLATNSAVWAIRTPETESAAGEARRAGGAVTLFDSEDDPEGALLNIIDEVELHHGTGSCPETPMTVVEVVGASATSDVRERFRLLGLPNVEPTPTGFLARRRGSHHAR
jgi:hypothetical protein